MPGAITFLMFSIEYWPLANNEQGGIVVHPSLLATRTVDLALSIDEDASFLHKFRAVGRWPYEVPGIT